ncbi:linoleate 13S-lipoxygenase 2-1, chloroplastic-like [Dorcoceras hygrometricum]|uniref:Linoleate 13S-lipoxygenase 2-1, chloroplastic-like n=1 Tax=Dorcoceras hygrometricum TaxID=472368 RepID=A0A2Z7B5D4_9LAMI|nr:linoleate 13S-lipoxygenase 2-1, chloroplastic-like [Dorcoceras hygrometricum]
MLKQNLKNYSKSCCSLMSAGALHKAPDLVSFGAAVSVGVKINSNIPARSISKRGPGGVKAVSVSPKKTATTVKADITVLQTVGGVLSHLGLDRGIDDITDLLGKTLLVELVAANSRPET